MGISIILPQRQLPLWSGPVDEALWPVDDDAGNTSLMTGAAFTAGVSGVQIMFANATAGTSTTVAALSGKTVHAVLRGGYGCGKVVAVAPVGNQVQQDGTSLIVAENQDWAEDEELTIFYTN